MNNTKNKNVDIEFISFKSIYKGLKRRKNLYYSIIGITVLATTVFSFSVKRIWSGYFNIVIKEEQRLDSGQNNLMSKINLPDQLKNKKLNNDLLTELLIIQSPYVLEPIYLDIRNKLSDEGINNKKLTYKKWLEEYLSITLEEDTSVVKIIYKDTDKKRILYVLNKISEAYKKYSIKERKDSIEKELQYLNEQIIEYKDKSKISQKIAEEYALKNELNMFMNNKNKFNYEKSRIAIANRIEYLNLQIKRLKSLDKNPEIFLYTGLTITELKNKEIYKEVEALERKIAIERSKFRDNDKYIILLKNRRSLLIDLVKKETLSYLEALREDAIAKKNAADRPIDVVIKFRELIRETERNNYLLNNLEESQQRTALEQAKIADSWNIISNPTLDLYPVWPRKKLLIFISIISSAIIGYILSFLLDKKEGVIHDNIRLRSLLDERKLIDLSDLPIDAWESYLKLLESNLKKNLESNKIDLLVIGSYNKDKLDTLDKFCSSIFKNNQITTYNQISECINRKNIIAIASCGYIKDKEIIEYNKKLDLNNIDIIYYIVI